MNILYKESPFIDESPMNTPGYINTPGGLHGF